MSWREHILRVGLLADSIVKADSADAAVGWLEMVFLDAGHDEASVRRDIANWSGQVVSGGFLAGYDYEPAYPGLIRAVDELCPQRQLHGCDWWVQL